MDKDEIKSLSERAIRMLEEQQYYSDLEAVAYYFDNEPAVGTAEETEFNKIVDRIVAHEDKYYPIGG